MPAKIAVTAGPEQGAEFWIEEEVLRIGAAANNAVCLHSSGIPGHAATLEFRDGRYNVYNRSDQPLFLDGQPIETMASARWNANHDLYLNNEVILRLVIEGDPAPAKKPASRIFLEQEEGEAVKETSPEDEEEKRKAEKSKTLQQWAIIAIVIGTLAFVLFVDTETGSDEKKENPAASFDSLVAEMVKKEKVGPKNSSEEEKSYAARMLQYRKGLQEARIAELRKDEDQAILLYGLIRDELLREKGTPYQLDDLEKKVLKFVISRLQK